MGATGSENSSLKLYLYSNRWYTTLLDKYLTFVLQKPGGFQMKRGGGDLEPSYACVIFSACEKHQSMTSSIRVR